MSQLQVTGEAKIRDIQGPVVANDGVVTALDGAASQYVRGDGTLADFPTSTGGGSSVSYYLNSSVSQGTIGGVAYRELSKDPIIGAGTDIAISSNGYVANYITDVNDPDVTIVAGGNFNCEFYFSVNNNTGNPTTYAELYKYDGTTFTLLGSSVGVPEYINQGTIIAPYYFAIPVPTSALALTDRLAIRIYVNVDGRTVTLHTENSHLCQVVTTLSKGMVSLNNLTDQSQFLTTGTSGTNFAIASTGDTHTFNLPVASATNTGKLSSTDWSTFNNKQNTITDPITGTGASTQIAYFNSPTSITSEAAFNYDASTNRLGVNTSVPNATIGANAATDSGYSLLLKNDNANYNGIGFATDSTYGNLIATEKLGTALTRNLTLLNQSGYISLTEAGNLGVNILTPNTGLDIYNGTSAYLWLHTANSGITGTDGVRLALFNTNGANLRNFDGSFSITAEGDFSVITLGAENFRVNSADGSIYQSKVANAMLKSVSGVITAAVAGTDYVLPSALTGYVPTSRTLTINGTAYDLSADRSWSVGTMGGSGVSGRVAYYDGTNSITSEGGFIYDSSTNRLGVNTTVPNATIGADSALDSGYGLLIKTGSSNYNGIGIAVDSTYGNLISTEKLGSASARNLTLLNQSGFVSLTESGNLGLNVLTPAVSGNGIDIYGSTSVGLRFHTAASGTTVSDGAGINFSAANNLGITNYEAGTIDIVTNGNSGVFIDSSGNVGIKGATPSSALTVNGGAAISALTTGQIVFPTSGGTLAGSSSLFWDNTNGKLGVGTSTLSGARVTISSSSEANHLQLVSNAPAMTFINAISYSYYATVGMATANNNFITGAVQGDLVLGAYDTSNIWFYNANTNTSRMRLDGSGAAIFSGSVTARGPKSQIVVDGNSVGAAISLNNSIVGVNRRNWLIGTEENVEGDFVIKRSTVSGGTATTNVLSLSRDGAATFSSNLSAAQATFTSATNPLIIKGTNASTQWTEYYYNTSTLLGYIGNGSGILTGGLSSDFIFRSETDFVIATGGNNRRLTITSGGNVGIGTSSPTNPLHIVSNTVSQLNVAALSGNTNAQINLEPTGTGVALIGPASAFPLTFRTDATERMRITTGGNVGIGTSSPTYLLQINSSTTAAHIHLTNSTTGSTSNDGTRLFAAGVDTYIANREVGAIIFETSDIERMRIISSGNINLNDTVYNNTATAVARILYIGSDYRIGGLASIRESKKNIENISNVDWIYNLNPVTFNYRKKDEEEKYTDEIYDELVYGLIAEDTAPIADFLVNYNNKEDGSKEMVGIEYMRLITPMLKAIQELKAEIEELKALINK